MFYSIIVTRDVEGGIAKEGAIPWNIPSNVDRFNEVTLYCAIVMGRKTWDTLKSPITNRINIVITSNNIEVPECVHVVHNYDDLDKLLLTLPIRGVFFIGGNTVYREVLNRYNITSINMTEVLKRYNCDTFFPKITSVYDEITSIHTDGNITYRYRCLYTPIPYDGNHQERKYLYLLDKVLGYGKYRDDRTGVGTLSLFGDEYLSFNLEEGFPLLTTKKVYWRGVVEELLFFLRGDTDNSKLLDKKVNIWSGNSSREYLDNLGLHDRLEGDLGPVYGWQWRHFGAKYIDCKTDYTNQGYNQLMEVVRQLKNDSKSRRIIMTAWNPIDLKTMCLPPCHVLYQFNVEDDKLSCCMYQRSADLFLGVPFNIASTALLTHLLAKTCDLVASKITIYYGDAHIYLNHIDQVREQVNRKPYPFPKLHIKVKRDNIDEYNRDDIILTNYSHHPEIKAKMAV